MQGSLLETVERGGLPNGAGGCEADHQEGGERWIDELFALSVGWRINQNRAILEADDDQQGVSSTSIATFLAMDGDTLSIAFSFVEVHRGSGSE